MPRKSATENVRKICGCAKWKTCAHPWYVDYREKARGALRQRLGPLVGREPKDYADAVAEARRAIVAWREGRDPKGLVPADDPTIAQLLAEYTKERPRRERNRWQVGCILATTCPGFARTFGTMRASEVTADTLKAFRRARPMIAGNRDLALLRAAFNWAVLNGLLQRSPFRIGDVPAVRLGREEPRSRRLHPGEEERLLEGAGRLHDLIVAALETGCRLGELLSLQWHQVRFAPHLRSTLRQPVEIVLPAGKTKAKKTRRVPVSSVLAGVLQRRRHDPSGEPIPQDGYVFGDEVGRQRKSIKTPWGNLLKRAKITGLHFHDLRREAGSRWMDAKTPLATIQRWLGHANIAQTSTYLGASLGADEREMQDYERRIGRAPLTHVDVFGDPNGSEPSRSDNVTTENTQQNPIGSEPTGTIH